MGFQKFVSLIVCVLCMSWPTSVLSEESVAQVTDRQAKPGIFVIGGTRATGFQVVKRLVERGEDVTVLVRPTSDLSNLEPLGVKTVVGDALDLSSLEAAMTSGDYRMVFSSLGGKGSDGNWVDVPGTKNAIDATKTAEIPHFFLVSTIGAGDSKDALPWYFKLILRSAIQRKNESEAYLFDSGLDYTIVRPGGLTDDTETGTGMLTEDRSTMGFISRAELGRLIVEAIYDQSSVNKIFSAADAGG